MSPPYYIGVDVGTGSARAALVDSTGEILSESTYATTTWRDEKNAEIFEQSTTDIWDKISRACKDVIRDAKINKQDVKGVGFDATCSLAVTDSSGVPVSVSPDAWGKGTDKRDIILWADHRASEEAKAINATDSVVLKYVGGTMSLEMEIPKVLWLKKNMPKELFDQCMFFDLPDYLTYRATNNLARSNCSLACKCSYLPPGVEDSKGWNHDFFNKIGLGDVANDNFKQVGGIPGQGELILTAGQPVGNGLSKQAAEDLGLAEGTPVGSGVIDAYAGWIGTVAAKIEGEKDANLLDSRHRLAAIAGTSTCHIVQSPDAVTVKGVWGPYLHAVFPGYWMNEGGQSSTGQLLDFMVETHPAFVKLTEMAKEKGKHHFALLGDLLEEMRQEQKAPFLAYLTRNIQLYPDLWGNRSPLADSTMRGMFIGMQLDRGVKDLALRYLATCEAIALQTRHIVDSMNDSGHQITSIFMSGGLVKNPILMQLIADICGMPVQLPFSVSASVVLGSAMLGAAAGSEEETKLGPITSQADAEKRSHALKDRLWDIMVKMTRSGSTVSPKAEEKERKLLQVKYDIFLQCIKLQRQWRDETEKALA